jgi:DNA polymerase III psi subunit
MYCTATDVICIVLSALTLEPSKCEIMRTFVLYTQAQHVVWHTWEIAVQSAERAYRRGDLRAAEAAEQAKDAIWYANPWIGY